MCCEMSNMEDGCVGALSQHKEAKTFIEALSTLQYLCILCLAKLLIIYITDYTVTRGSQSVVRGPPVVDERFPGGPKLNYGQTVTKLKLP